MRTIDNILASAFLLLLVYVVSYSVLVCRGCNGVLITLCGHYTAGDKLPIVASYRYGGHRAEDIYSPLHRLDRRLRPDYWTFTFRTPGTASHHESIPTQDGTANGSQPTSSQ